MSSFLRKRGVHDLTPLPDFPDDYEPEIIEFFDQEGILFTQTPLGSFESDRPHQHQGDYLAVYLDGQLAFFLENGEILLNRIHHLSQLRNLFDDAH